MEYYKDAKVFQLYWTDRDVSKNDLDEYQRRLKEPDCTAIIKNFRIYKKAVTINKGDGPQLFVIWAEDITQDEIKDLREQVTKALSDPEYIIQTGYEIHISAYNRDPDPNAFFVVTADGASEEQIIDLKEQVDKALLDPNYMIVTSYQVYFESRKRSL